MVVRHPNGQIEIYGYPEDVFPPTDFHSATLRGDHILIVGCLGHPKQRAQATPIYRLDLSDFSISECKTSGDGPLRLHEHKAELSADGTTLICHAGRDVHPTEGWIVENLTTWHLDLQSFAWSAAGTKPCTRWMLMREEEGDNDLWGIGLVAQYQRAGRTSKTAESYRKKFAARGLVVDTTLHAARFRLPVPHKVLPNKDDDSPRTKRIEIGGTVVRIYEGSDRIDVAIEGHLPSSTRDALVQFGLDTYAALEGVPYKVVHL